MAVPTPTFSDKGFVAPDERTEVLPAVEADIDAAMGGGLNPALETPQGQLSASLAACIGNAYDAFCNLTQQMDPAFNYGRFQDAIARIYFIERIPAEPTVVQATCLGAEGTVIPAGALAIAADGNLYAANDGGTIGVSGTVSLSFSCLTYGPIPLPAGNLNTIYQTITGWDSITNPAEGVIGRDTESRAQFEQRRFQSVAKNARGFLPSVLGAVLGVDNVLDAFVTENFTGSPATISGVVIDPHTIYVAAVGGTDAAVADAIWSKKAPGCGFTGNTSVVVYDSQNYSPPYPSYTVKFERPAALAIIFAVNIVDSAQVPSDAQAQVANAIVAAFAGEDGGTRARIGSTIYASRFFGAVSKLGAWAQIISLQIGSTNTPAAAFTASIADTTMTVSAVASGALAVGQSVIGANVADGSIIEAQLTGSAGSTGTYRLATTQTVSSETMYGVIGDHNSITVRADEAPTVTPADVVVTIT